MSVWPPVISQIGYPGAGDIDDCWCVATIWAAIASDRDARRPTVPQFRWAAGDPDDGHRDGGSNDECMDGAEGIWRGNPDPTRWESRSWDAFAALVKAGRPASLAVRSSLLPERFRFGFGGAHRVGLCWDTTYKLMNPLARSGSPLQPISEGEVKRAAVGLLPDRIVRAVLFPDPKLLKLRWGGSRTDPYPDRTRTDQPDVNIHIAPAASSRTVAVIEEAGTLFIAYQRVKRTDGWWYGGKAGNRWVRGDRLSHEGGST